MDYIVEQGMDLATIELEEETKVIFSFIPKIYAVKAVEGTVTVALRAGAEAGEDGVRSISDGEVTLIKPTLDEKIYINGTATVEVWAGDSAVESPFKKQSKGGGGSGGDGTHYKGTTTTAITNGSTTNPITIDGESYTAVFGDVVVYNYTEFVFDGTTWSEFGRPFDTTPTSGSANAVTSGGIYSLIHKGTGTNSVILNQGNTASSVHTIAGGYHTSASGQQSTAFGNETIASGHHSFGAGQYIRANQLNMAAVGQFNSPRTNDLFNVGNGTSSDARSNIVEVNSTSLNVNGDIQRNGVNIYPLVYDAETESFVFGGQSS